MKLGYSKINSTIDTAHKYSRSLDFSTTSYSKTHLDQICDHANIIQMDTSITNDSTSAKTTQDYSSSSSSFSPRKRHDGDHHPEDQVENVTRKVADNKAAFRSNDNTAAVLRRNGSVSSMSAVKRVFSMRRSSSVSERYCRIQDQSGTLASPIDDDEFEEEDKGTRSAKKKHGGGKILKACKRFFWTSLN